MIYIMVENISGSVIKSQVISVLSYLTQHFDLDVHLLALERKSLCRDSDYLDELRRELERHRIKLHLFVHHGRRHPLTYINLGRMVLRALGLLLKDKQRVIMARNIHAAFAALPLRLLFPGSYLLLDLRGLFVQELVLKGLLKPQSVLHRILEWMELCSYTVSDHILCVSKHLAQHLVETVGRKKEISVIPCCVESDFLALDVAKSTKIAQELGLTDKFVVVYAGSVTSWNLVEPMLDLFALLRKIQPAAHFLFLTAATDQAEQAFREKNWPPQEYTIMTVPHREIQNYIALADLAVLLREDNLVNRVASPVKFGEYMACGVPICITPFVGDLSELVIQHNVGLVVDRDDKDIDMKLEAFVQEIQHHREGYRRRCIELSRAYFDRKAYHAIYENIVKKEQM